MPIHKDQRSTLLLVGALSLTLCAIAMFFGIRFVLEELSISAQIRWDLVMLGGIIGLLFLLTAVGAVIAVITGKVPRFVQKITAVNDEGESEPTGNKLFDMKVSTAWLLLPVAFAVLLLITTFIIVPMILGN